MRALILILAIALGMPAAAQEPGEDTLLTCGYLCGEDGTPLTTTGDAPPDTGLVTRIFIGAFSEACSWAIGGGPGMIGPEVNDFSYRPAYALPGEPEQTLRLYRFFCGSGAYNERHVYLAWTADSGVRPISFPAPTLDIRYSGDDVDARIESLTVTGIGARHELVNSRLDLEARTITEWSCWRGLCDASGRGVWVLDGDTFRLLTYDVDPSYDGEVNQFRVVDFSEPRVVDTSEPLPPTTALEEHFADEE